MTLEDAHVNCNVRVKHHKRSGDSSAYMWVITDGLSCMDMAVIVY